MANKVTNKVTVTEPQLVTRDDVNTALGAMSKLLSERVALVATREPVLRQLQAELDELLEPIDAHYKELEGQITAYVERHLNEIGDKRSIEYPNGTIALRNTESLEIADKTATVAKLRAMGLTECIKDDPSPVKAALKRLGAEVLALVGVVINKGVSVTVKPLGKE